MDSTRETLVADAPEVARRVLARWDRIIEREPWWSIDHVSEDHLETLIRATAEAALREHPDEAVIRTFVATALAHGRDRREEGHRDAMVHHEFLLLRRALREDLKEQLGVSRETHVASTRLDSALGHAEIASLYGYHEHALPSEAAALAPDRLTREWLRIAGDWPMPEAA